MPKIEKLAEPEALKTILAVNQTSSWQHELAILIRYVSILVVVGINKIKEKN